MSKRHRAARPPPDEQQPEGIAGDVIRVFWDHGGGPLWDAEGPLPSDADWLRTVMHLSHSLAAEIEDWAQHLDAWPHDDVFPTSLRRQGDRIARRLGDELSGRYELRWQF